MFIPDETWIRVLLLQRLLEDMHEQFGGSRNSVSGHEGASPRDESISAMLLRQAKEVCAIYGESQGSFDEAPLDEREATLILAGLGYDEHICNASMDEIDVELWESKSLLRQLHLDLLRFVPIDRRSELKGEDHGMGYHIHYLEKNERTTLLLLFDQEESPTDSPVLYWESHTRRKAKSVDAPHFGHKKRSKIYTAASHILDGRDKKAFRPLKTDSQIFFPEGM